MKTVLIYTTGMCAYCLQAKKLLALLNVTPTEVRVDQDAQALGEMLQKTGRRTVPQIYIGDRYIGGFQELNTLHNSGELQALLRE